MHKTTIQYSIKYQVMISPKELLNAEKCKCLNSVHLLPIPTVFDPGVNSCRVRSFWSRSLRSGTLRSRSFGSEAKFGQFGRGHYGPGHFGRGHFCLYFRH